MKKIEKFRNIGQKLKASIQENLEADYLQYGKKWRPIKRKLEENMEHDGVYFE